MKRLYLRYKKKCTHTLNQESKCGSIARILHGRNRFLTRRSYVYQQTENEDPESEMARKAIGKRTLYRFGNLDDGTLW